MRSSCSVTCPNHPPAIGLALCLWAAFASSVTPGTTILPAAHAEENPVLRIADVQRLPRAEAKGRLVAVGGVVAWIQLPDHSRLTIQDGQRGMWVATTDPLPKSPDVWEGSKQVLESLEPGDQIEIAGLVDATIRMVGTTSAAFNARGELLYPRVRVMRATDITVLAPPPCPPCSVPFVPLPMIGECRAETTFGHRLRTEGTINDLFPGGFHLQEGAVGIRVETAQPTTAAVDDRVEVAGFLDRRRHAVDMHQALVRVLRKDNAREPSEVTPADIVRHFQDARLGGDLSIDTAPGRGTTIAVRITETDLDGAVDLDAQATAGSTARVAASDGSL